MTDIPPIDIRFEIRLNATSPNWTRESYDTIYGREGIRQLDSFYRWILRMIKPLPGLKLLDVACGEGTLQVMARKHYAMQVFGTDLSVAALKIATADGAGPTAVCGSEVLPFADNSFDYVTCIGSLEHFLDTRASVREMARVLRPDGIACVFVPNTYSIIGNVYTALKTGMSTVDKQPLQRYAARGEWQMLLEQNGLEVMRTFKYEREPPDSFADAFWYLCHPRALIRLGVMPFIPTNWANHIGYICRPQKGLGS
jgi:2-polyprenyl-3-methyl-5-hydroxy-6-metoxy-1,4-benzoquinol methylase